MSAIRNCSKSRNKQKKKKKIKGKGLKIMNKQLFLLVITIFTTQMAGQKPGKRSAYSYDEHTGNVIVKDISWNQGSLTVDLEQTGRLAWIGAAFGNEMRYDKSSKPLGYAVLTTAALIRVKTGTAIFGPRTLTKTVAMNIPVALLFGLIKSTNPDITCDRAFFLSKAVVEGALYLRTAQLTENLSPCKYEDSKTESE